MGEPLPVNGAGKLPTTSSRHHQKLPKNGNRSDTSNRLVRITPDSIVTGYLLLFGELTPAIPPGATIHLTRRGDVALRLAPSQDAGLDPHRAGWSAPSYRPTHPTGGTAPAVRLPAAAPAARAAASAPRAACAVRRVVRRRWRRTAERSDHPGRAYRVRPREAGHDPGCSIGRGLAASDPGPGTGVRHSAIMQARRIATPAAVRRARVLPAIPPLAGRRRQRLLRQASSLHRR